MSTNPDHFRPRESAGGQQYLDATIRTASPARLRLMLLQRSVEVACVLSDTWRHGLNPGTNEHSLKLLDLLNELLAGVKGSETDSENQLCSQVADLYVFLMKHLVAAENNSDANRIDEIRLVLETEMETWQNVCATEASAIAVPPTADIQNTPAASSGLNFTA